jgi:Circularly permutated YpsA SLOG family
MGLEVARELGLPTCGTAPRGYRTEAGPDSSLAGFGLREHPKPAYVQRTRQNVMDSDGTVLYGDTESRGCKATIEFLPESEQTLPHQSCRRRTDCIYPRDPHPYPKCSGQPHEQTDAGFVRCVPEFASAGTAAYW